MKYNIGDKVNVKEDLVDGKIYGSGLSFIYTMNEYKGKTGEITEVTRKGYKLDISKNWQWSDDMLDEIKECKIIKIRKWSELHETRNTNWELRLVGLDEDSYFAIKSRLDKKTVTTVGIDQPKEKILYVLAGYDFDVEFLPEITITKKDRQWLDAMTLDFLDATKLIKTASLSNITLNRANCPFTTYLFNGLEYGKEYTIRELLEAKIED